MPFLFFKHKTAYEMLRSLVGSEMCIRDRCPGDRPAGTPLLWWQLGNYCLLYTSDAADDLTRVEHGRRRIFRKNKSLLTSLFFQAQDGVRYAQESRGLGDVYKRQVPWRPTSRDASSLVAAWEL